MRHQNVFEALLHHYTGSGEIMQPEVFKSKLTGFSHQEIIKGILMFDRYLDFERMEGNINWEL